MPATLLSSHREKHEQNVTVKTGAFPCQRQLRNFLKERKMAPDGPSRPRDSQGVRDAFC